MEAKEAFDSLVRDGVGPLLKAEGFARRRHSFNKWVGPNCQWVTFWPHRFSGSFVRNFHVELGVVYSKFYRFEHDGAAPPKFLSTKDSMFVVDLGELTPSRKQLIRSVSLKTEVPALSEELNNLMRTYALPFLRKHSEDEDLIRIWSEGIVQGLPDFQRYKLLALYLAEDGQAQKSRAVLEEWRASFQNPEAQPLIEKFMARIGPLVSSSH